MKDRFRLSWTDQHCERIRLAEIARQMEAQTCFRFQIKHTSRFCQSKTALLSAESTFGRQFNRRQSGFRFSVTRQRNCSRKAAAWSYASQDGVEICSKLDECAWMASIMLFEQGTVRDVDPVVCFDQTTQKEKFFSLLLAITVKTSSQLQV